MFNQYYQVFFVVTKYEIKILDAKSGRVRRTLNTLVERDSGSEIADFCFDEIHRRFYIADTNVRNAN